MDRRVGTGSVVGADVGAAAAREQRPQPQSSLQARGVRARMPDAERARAAAASI